MKVLVLGAGVIGVTSAWYLAQAGHEVTVVDRQAEPAMETSFANGGQISAAHAEPWARPALAAMQKAATVASVAKRIGVPSRESPASRPPPD